MVDLVVTAANTLAGSNSSTKQGTAGATITAGQVVYFDSATSNYKLADCNSATVAARSPAGFALNGASAGQPLMVQFAGDVTTGATMAPGVAYYLSGTPGGIRPVADMIAGDFPVILGIAKSATVMVMDLTEAGVAL